MSIQYCRVLLVGWVKGTVVSLFLVQEKRVLSYWFKEEVEESARAKMAQQFFKELVSPTQFPRGNKRKKEMHM